MGIKFYCPNGHWLHVKAFLAGRRGLCPTCGVTIEIPIASTPEAVAAGKESRPAGSVEESTDTIVLDLPEMAGAAATPTEAWSLPKDTTGADHHAAIHAHTGHDKATAAPATKWYLRVAAGEQYGPVKDEVVRRWLAEKQIDGSTLLWKDGWGEWQSAAAALAAREVVQQAGGAATLPLTLTANSVNSGPLPGILLQPAVQGDPAKRRAWTNREKTTAISLGLLGAVILLGATLLFMLFGQVQQPDADPASAPAKGSPSGE